MAGKDASAVDRSFERREQPFLYSWNRRLRHLHGISLRNVNISPAVHHNKNEYTTDDAYDLRTPSKLLAEAERASLPTSRSSSDLSKTTREPVTPELRRDSVHHDNNMGPPGRPSIGKLRRRSTLHWTGASPRTRQQKLEDLGMDRLVDTWFSIHHAGLEEPVYISEVMPKSMNPSFSAFDLDAAMAPISRSDILELKIWAKNSRMHRYRLLIDMHVNLRSLQFIGKALESFHHPLPENCVVFHLSDGIYTTFADLPADALHEPQLQGLQRTLPPTVSSTYDALMKLANLDDCIQDALQTRQKLEADINALLSHTKREDVTERIEAQKDRLNTVYSALESERKDVERLAKLKAKMHTAQNRRSQTIENAMQVKLKVSDMPHQRSEAIRTCQREGAKLEDMSRGQIRRVCEDMHTIFPIEPIKHKTLQFMIRGVHLPNSVFDDTNRDEIAAALGFTAQCVHQLSMYLSIPLPYAITVNASSSTISDRISMSLAQRGFPLYPTNVNYKFEYGVFLLNKDIEFLMNHMGLRVLDIRQTLPNLKYLLYILTAGTGDPPARKAGGIKGLLAGVASPHVSRRNSDDDSTHDGRHDKQASLDFVNRAVPGGLSMTRTMSPDTRDQRPKGERVERVPYRGRGLQEVG